MIKVRILTDKVQHLQGIGKTSGKPYELNIQAGYAYTVDVDGQVSEIPEKFEFILEKDQQPLKRGDYTLSPNAIYIDRNGRMSINPRLIPVPAPASK